MAILQARILEWVAMPSSKGSSQSRDQPRSPTLHADSLQSEPPEKPKILHGMAQRKKGGRRKEEREKENYLMMKNGQKT